MKLKKSKGKGYPDMATRRLLNGIENALSFDDVCSIPLYALVDFDPDGLAIFTTYRDGSRNFAHENHNLTASSLHLKGIRSDDVVPATSYHHTHCLPPVSERDRRRALNKLEAHMGSTDEEDAQLTRELQVMLMLNVKAEIEHLDVASSGVLDWVYQQVISA